MSKDKIAEVLRKYVPETAVDTCTNWILTKNIHLKLTRGRASKFGDYMPLKSGEGHRITVNHDLNKYSFLITFTHEVAHLETFSKFRNRVDPHGYEWKNEFRKLLNDFVKQDIFPEDIRSALNGYMINPAASSCSDINLLRTLRKYDENQEQVFHLEDLADGTKFSLHQSRSGQVFSKGEKRRTRFQCVDVKTDKKYLVSAIAEVICI
jgi:SprT protein